jgi:hypothetical protein
VTVGLSQDRKKSKKENEKKKKRKKRKSISRLTVVPILWCLDIRSQRFPVSDYRFHCALPECGLFDIRLHPACLGESYLHIGLLGASWTDLVGPSDLDALGFSYYCPGVLFILLFFLFFFFLFFSFV